MTTLFISHTDCHAHNMGKDHPESPTRLDAIQDQLLASGISAYLTPVDALLAQTSDLLRVHTPDYLALLEQRSPEQGLAQLDGDTMMCPATLNAALRAAGAAVQAVDEVMTGQANNAFCSVRPPGHHATPDQAMGFCFLNNVAIAARHAVATYQLSRVAVIDFDVHHGNGTESALAGDPHINMYSFFQHPYFPFSGTEPPANNMHNTPLAAYSGSAEVRSLVTEHWLPQLHAFAPELILISAGFDAHREDDMGQMKLSESDYQWITEQIMQIAERYAQGRVVSVLEGGYHLSALGRSVVSHIRGMIGI